MFRRAAAAFVLLAAAMIVGGSAIPSIRSPIGAPFNIRHCATTTPLRDHILTFCDAVVSRYYILGSLYLEIEPRLIESLRRADVVIIGNSRTRLSFATHAVADYFERKGIRYFILGAEGSGFRVPQLILERLGVRPKILMMNVEAYFVDVLEDANRDLVHYPERFRAEFTAFYFSKALHASICGSDIPAALRSLYCSGSDGLWRSVVNGAIHFDPGRELKLTPVEIPKDTRVSYVPFFMKHATAFLGSPAVARACVINHVVPWPDASLDVAREMSRQMGAALSIPDAGTLFTYDGLHLDPDSSERWSAAYMKAADSHIDACMRR